MLKCGVLGERLSHSFSPQIHAELGGYEFLLYEKKPEELENFVRNGDFDGLNVTIPYKKAVIPFCTGLSETARAIGSVNTLVRLKDGGLYGDNTDYFGFEYLLGQAGVDIAGGKAIILGSGGASLTVQAVLRDKGAREVIVVSRTGENNYENVHRHSDAIIIVNATPVGMYPNNGASPFTGLANFHNCRAVIDLIYNPAKTELLLDAEDCGIPGFGGLAMLVAQAKRGGGGFFWSKKTPPPPPPVTTPPYPSPP
ncbi:MAG: shikimate dehydrogenase, partial [Clostridiales bacterium]|nr:shikimate dehydrogenase [Clostridiales bacterium]